ncbi:hypothetical protein HPB52_000093 [Rhipicephalus sanguineus]|uniref:Uncharacterized protein n=1 Tax=Rhipicephalus sanguineus TaxID=34632 RepID=A0A9D4PU71_RHISA|nr:hypothetical protein HPB52_000093 [Rhipicephalus sanguineus]
MPPPEENSFYGRTSPVTSVDEDIGAVEPLVTINEIYSVDLGGFDIQVDMNSVQPSRNGSPPKSTTLHEESPEALEGPPPHLADYEYIGAAQPALLSTTIDDIFRSM